MTKSKWVAAAAAAALTGSAMAQNGNPIDDLLGGLNSVVAAGVPGIVVTLVAAVLLFRFFFGGFGSFGGD